MSTTDECLMYVDNILQLTIRYMYIYHNMCLHTSDAFNMQVINFTPQPISTTNGERESMNTSILSIESKPHIYA